MELDKLQGLPYVRITWALRIYPEAAIGGSVRFKCVENSCED